MPLIVVANSPNKEAALAGLERWKSKHADIANLIAVDDVLVDSMRGSSSNAAVAKPNRAIRLRNVTGPTFSVRASRSQARRSLSCIVLGVAFGADARLVAFEHAADIVAMHESD